MSVGWRTLTAAIASYNRRADVSRLVKLLGDQARESPEDWVDCDILVVLDGSTDGSKEALELDLSVPLTVIWQENAGLAAARNRCLAEARGELIWLLDDDLEPKPETLRRHRLAHARAQGREMSDGRVAPDGWAAPQDQDLPLVLLGPCVVPDSSAMSAPVARWWQLRHEPTSRRVERFDEIWLANSSGPVSVFQSVGGFDSRFVGYGFEDAELGARLLAAGVDIEIDAEAVAWHHTTVDERLTVTRAFDMGRNTVHMIEAHPELAHVYFRQSYDSWRTRVIATMARSVTPGLMRRLLVLTSRGAEAASRLARPLGERVSGRLFQMASFSSFCAGVMSTDPKLLPSILGGGG